MLFNSLHFILFFPIVTVLYYALPHRLRCGLLLAASCYFYAVFKPIYILILVFTITIDYFAGLMIEAKAGASRKRYLIASIAANIGVLSVFKYYNFVNSSLAALFHLSGLSYKIPFLRLLLPIGLSFHVFQSLSYTIEVYRGHQLPERNFLIFALYVMFYPQLVAGPIERPQNMLHQFHERHAFDYHRAVSGLQLMMLGMFKKVVIADRLAPFVNSVYDHPHDYPGISLILSTVFFAFQIYCDFSGYSDIALGSAEVMGFTLMKNFDRPYFSRSIGEFWKRWHISLSTWFRDYLYIPLGGNRVAASRMYFNLMVTFLVSGLWHGANWTFVIWGSLNGAYLIAEQLGRKLFRESLLPAGIGHALSVARTFVLTCLAWIFFRAASLKDAFYVSSHLFSGFHDLPHVLLNRGFQKKYILMMQGQEQFVIGVCVVIALILLELIASRGDLREQLQARSLGFRWAAYYACTAAIVFFGAFNSSQQFIYFQF